MAGGCTFDIYKIWLLGQLASDRDCDAILVFVRFEFGKVKLAKSLCGRYALNAYARTVV